MKLADRRKSMFIALLIGLLFGFSAQAFAGDFCWRKSYGRTAGTAPSYQCAPDKEQSKDAMGVICYPKCESGYTGVGPVCWQDCPTGYRDDGGYCAKPAPSFKNASLEVKLGCPAGGFPDPNGNCYSCPSGFNRTWDPVTAGTACAKTLVGPFSNATLLGKNLTTCPSGSFFDPNGNCYRCPSGSVRTASAVTSPQACAADPGCSGMFGDIGVSCTKKSYGRTAGTVATPTCPSGQQLDGLLCYPTCSSEYLGGGPVCWQSCKQVALKFECGMGCATDNASCGEATMDMVMSIWDAAQNITLLVATGGISSVKDWGQGVLMSAVADAPTMSEQASIAAFCAADVNGCKDVKQEDLRIVASIIVAAKKNEEWKPNAQMLKDVKLFDPTGIVGIISAYAKEMCEGEVPLDAYKVSTRFLPPLPARKIIVGPPVTLLANSGKLYPGEIAHLVRTDDGQITAYQRREVGQISFDQGKHWEPDFPAVHLSGNHLKMTATDSDPGTGSMLTWVDPKSKVFRMRFGGPKAASESAVYPDTLTAVAAASLSDGSLLTINQGRRIEFRGQSIYLREFDVATAVKTAQTTKQRAPTVKEWRWSTFLKDQPIVIDSQGGFNFLSSRGMQAVASTDEGVYLITVKATEASDHKTPTKFEASFETLPPVPLRKTVANPQITALDIDNLGRVWVVDKTEHVTVLMGGSKGRWQPIEMVRQGKEVLGKAVAVVDSQVCVIEKFNKSSDQMNFLRPQITCFVGK